MESLQDKYAPNSICFGCGPKNPKGLHIKSFPQGESLVAEWTPEPHHAAFSDFASGGIMSVLLDCHGNWTAAYSLMRSRGLDSLPGTVTAEYTVRFLRPTPIDKAWHLKAWPTRIDGDRVFVEGEVEAGGLKTATMSGLFVAVKEGHPAYHRWQ
ncbi:MAG: PaaI family thioesterase [Nitrososphaerales archaeon]